MRFFLLIYRYPHNITELQELKIYIRMFVIIYCDKLLFSKFGVYYIFEKCARCLLHVFLRIFVNANCNQKLLF